MIVDFETLFDCIKHLFSSMADVTEIAGIFLIIVLVSLFGAGILIKKQESDEREEFDNQVDEVSEMLNNNTSEKEKENMRKHVEDVIDMLNSRGVKI